MSETIMLIDHYNTETRLCVVKNQILEDFDYELVDQKMKKGNIYRAKVMRIEPSLQAVFVDYGQEKQGFLPFSEIHPDFFCKKGHKKSAEVSVAEITESGLDGLDDEGESERIRVKVKPSGARVQDVIKRNQEVLVQVIKDARGTKGAALTTYISLPGRFSILMPNTPNSNGISKKITAAADRDALKDIVSSLEKDPAMSMIIRTAGIGKKKNEIKRDYDYLVRLWKDIIGKKVTSPGLVHEEQDLLIRALRDLYKGDINRVIIQGEEAFKKAKSFMKVFMPSHAKHVTLYQEAMPLFEKYQMEDQIQAIYHHTVTLPSGGEIVINPTEALVAIDVNSAKSKQENTIEETAYKTNLEAAQMIARHLRLRDLSGLIVIDFIDTSENKRNDIEKMMKDMVKDDRARIKIGKISGFGLLELSRQRMRQSLIESGTFLCQACEGTGRLPSVILSSLHRLRHLEKTIRLLLEQEKSGLSHKAVLPLFRIRTCIESASFLLNEHRKDLLKIEERHHVRIEVLGDFTLSMDAFDIEYVKTMPIKKTPRIGEKTMDKTREKSFSVNLNEKETMIVQEDGQTKTEKKQSYVQCASGHTSKTQEKKGFHDGKKKNTPGVLKSTCHTENSSHQTEVKQNTVMVGKEEILTPAMAIMDIKTEEKILPLKETSSSKRRRLRRIKSLKKDGNDQKTEPENSIKDLPPSPLNISVLHEKKEKTIPFPLTVKLPQFNSKSLEPTAHIKLPPRRHNNLVSFYDLHANKVKVDRADVSDRIQPRKKNSTEKCHNEKTLKEQSPHEKRPNKSVNHQSTKKKNHGTEANALGRDTLTSPQLSPLRNSKSIDVHNETTMGRYDLDNVSKDNHGEKSGQVSSNKKNRVKKNVQNKVVKKTQETNLFLKDAPISDQANVEKRNTQSQSPNHHVLDSENSMIHDKKIVGRRPKKKIEPPLTV